jgi:SOS response regulatory protein OraA/RecX
VGEPNPIDLAARALQQGDRTRQEIDEKLARAGIGAVARSESLTTLERLGYVDDDRFAADRAQALAARGYGDAYIRFDLERHGAEAESVTRALAVLEPESDRARDQLARLGAGSGRLEKAVAKLSRKGFADESLEGIVAARDDLA